MTRDLGKISLLAVALIAGCGSPVDVASATADSAGPVANVTTVNPERATLRLVTEGPGRVEPFESTPVHAKLAGYVREVLVDIGDHVKAGQALATLEVPEVEADGLRASAAVAQAEAELRQAKAAIDVARAMVGAAEARGAEAAATTHRTDAEVARWRAESGRIDQLLRESAVTGGLRDETRSKLESALASAEESEAKVATAKAAAREAEAGLAKSEADADAAEARLDVARADAKRADAFVGYQKIVAPFDGVVTLRNVDTGHLTVPGGTAHPLFVVDRADKVTVVVGVPESDATLVGPGDPARVRLPGVAGRTIEGKVTRTSGSLDHANRALRAEIDLPAEFEGAPIRPGTYAYATIVAEERPDVVTVPVAAVVREGGKAYCVVVAENKASRRGVTLGITEAARVEVVSGLSASDVIVASNADSLADGQPVQSSQAAKPEAAPVKK